MSIKYFWQCLLGPTVFSIPSLGNSIELVPYMGNSMETIAAGGIRCLDLAVGVMKFSCIFWIPVFVKKAYQGDSLLHYIKWISGIVMFYYSLKLLRGLGRSLNNDYIEFVKLLERAEKGKKVEEMEKLHRYEFSFSHWPARYEVQPREITQPRLMTPVTGNHPPNNYFWSSLMYVLANYLGVYMAYPGCTSFFNSMLSSHIQEARKKIRRQHQIERVKIMARDGNAIEAFYRDRRGNRGSEIVMICCEGNAGYPEIGSAAIALESNYSVIGWNHPGFAGSTGLPFPQAEQNAMEAVIQFALNDLGFPLDRICLFAWSIGGYTATWAAMNYPGIHGLVLDATFDDIEALSEKALPAVVYPLVLRTVRAHFNLNNIGHLRSYNGPLHIIRRSRDEVISTGFIPSLATNRANFLIIDVMKRRYPQLLGDIECATALEEYLRGSPIDNQALFRQYSMDHASCKETLKTYLRKNGFVSRDKFSFPQQLGENMSSTEKCQMLLFLVSNYLMDFDATHCEPLPPDRFVAPWSELDVLS